MVEMGPVLGLAEHAVSVALHQYDGLASTFPRFWALCEEGRLDLESAGGLVEAARTIAHPEDVAEFAQQMADYLDRHDDPESPLVPSTRQQLSRAAHYRKRKFERKDDEQGFAEAFAERRVRLTLDDNGMGHLGCTTACTTSSWPTTGWHWSPASAAPRRARTGRSSRCAPTPSSTSCSAGSRWARSPPSSRTTRSWGAGRARSST